MKNIPTIRDLDRCTDTRRHRTVALVGAAAAILAASWAASYTLAPLGVAIFSLFDFY